MGTIALYVLAGLVLIGILLLALVIVGKSFYRPVFHKAEIMDISVKTIEIDRNGNDGLICQDNIRADIKVTFFVRVNESETDVLKVAKSIGCARASTRETLEELFSAKFSEALKTVGKQMDFVDLYKERDTFKEQIIAVIGRDLNGYFLEDAAIDYLEQTPKSSLDPDNILDAQGIRRITEITAAEAVITNEFEQDKRRDIKDKDVKTEMTVLELEKQEEEAKAVQKRQVEIIRATEAASTAEVEEQQRTKAEEARIKADEAIAVAEEAKQRQIEIAIKNKERAIAVEQERVMRDQQIEQVEREKIVAVKDVEKDKAVEVEKKLIQEVIRERVAVEKTVAEEQEKIKDTVAIAGANRQRECEIIEAEREAQENLINVTKAAEAKELAAKRIYEEQKTLAEADLIKAQKHAEAELVKAEKAAEGKKLLAAGVTAEEAASGLAKVNVQKAEAEAIQLTGDAEGQAISAKGLAQADVTEKQLAAEASGIGAKGLAEAEATGAIGKAEADASAAKFHADAEGISEKADAMKKFDEVGRDHEEFKLELGKAERIELAQIDVNRQIAEAQARVLGEAMKSANIDIVGGGDDFLEKFMRSVSVAKAIDGFVANSTTTQDVVGALTDGDGTVIDRVRRMVEDSGMSSEDVKNLTVSAVLAKLATSVKSADDKAEITSLQGLVKQLGIGELAALWLAK
jgi:uncharacterized membrane protein YqiK